MEGRTKYLIVYLYNTVADGRTRGQGRNPPPPHTAASNLRVFTIFDLLTQGQTEPGETGGGTDRETNGKIDGRTDGWKERLAEAPSA